MTTLGLAAKSEEEEQAEGAKAASLKVEVAKRMALGGGWSIGAAIVFGVFEILRSDPKDAFPLLENWGPKAIGSIIAVYMIYDLAKLVLKLAGRSVEAQERSAVAQQRLADKDDRQMQEMQTLTAFTAQQSERHYTMLGDLHTGLAAVNRKLDDMKKG